jgi:hypothetical protein
VGGEERQGCGNSRSAKCEKEAKKDTIDRKKVRKKERKRTKREVKAQKHPEPG